MQENEFEKEVQQKMEAFTINPSAAVWDKISIAVKKQKKRRRIIWLFFIFLFIGSIFLSPQINNYFKKSTETSFLQSDKTHLKISNKEVSDIKNLKTVLKKITTNLISSKSLKSPDSSVAGNVQIKSAAPLFKDIEERSSIKNLNNKIVNTAGKKQIKIKAGFLYETIDSPTVTKEAVSQQVEQNFANGDATKMIANKKRDSAIQTVTSNKVLDSVKPKPAPVYSGASKLAQAKKSKWNMGIYLAAGRAVTNNSLLGFNNPNANAIYSSAPGSNAGQGVVYQPSSIKPGIGFILGVSATHSLSLKTNIVIGLNYKLINSSLLVGQQMVVNNEIVYGVGIIKNYQNHFHFLELPITFQRRVVNIKKHPVFVDAGMYIAQLLNTNALQFNTVQGYYFLDNKIFNKTIVGLSAGFSFYIGSNNLAPLILGAQINYSPATIAGTGFYAKSHYSFVGIKLQKILSKK